MQLTASRTTTPGVLHSCGDEQADSREEVPMPRGPRLAGPGEAHHVMARGIERRLIFRDDHDRERFLFRLAQGIRSTDMRCHAFAEMPNHFHLLLRTGETPLSRFMHRLLTAYAGDFNRRHGRVGHLFQNRFKSRLIDSEEGFIAVVRYIHMNPVKARIVPDLRSLAWWPWTGHAGLMGKRRASFLDTAFVLRQFAEDRAVARKRLIRWMVKWEEGDPAELDVDGKSDQGTPPGSRPEAQPPDALERERTLQVVRAMGWDLDRLIASVCDRMRIPETSLRSGRRTAPVSRAREAIAWLASERLGLTRVSVARATGVSHQAVTRALDRAGEHARSIEAYFPELVA